MTQETFERFDTAGHAVLERDPVLCAAGAAYRAGGPLEALLAEVARPGHEEVKRFVGEFSEAIRASLNLK